MDEKRCDGREELWKMYDSHVLQGRHHETQRSTVIGLVLAIATGLLGIASLDDSVAGRFDAGIGVLLVALGLFGAGFAAKHYERFNLHMERARGYREALDELLQLPGGKTLVSIKEAADKRHKMAQAGLRRAAPAAKEGQPSAEPAGAEAQPPVGGEEIPAEGGEKDGAKDGAGKGAEKGAEEADKILSRLHHWWLALNLAISAVGLVVIVTALVQKPDAAAPAPKTDLEAGGGR
ncbi:MAG TPA: hypothetical protein VF702_00490 [Allosphingosinicella sp.]|jgi:hypothetical protein